MTRTTRRALDAWADRVRQHHLQNALAELENRDLDDEQRAAIATCSRELVDEILRCPRWRLGTGEGDAREVSALFDVGEK